MVSRRRTQGGDFRKVLLSFAVTDLDRLDGYLDWYNNNHPGEHLSRSAMLSRILNQHIDTAGFDGADARKFVSHARDSRKGREAKASAKKSGKR